MDAMANSRSFPNEAALPTTDHDMALQKISQSKKESSEVRDQLRALAGECYSFLHDLMLMFSSLIDKNI